MTDTIETCAICDCDQFQLISKWKSFKIVRCLSCGVVCSNPRPDETELLRIYGDGTILNQPSENEVREKIEFPKWKLKEHAHILRVLARFGIRAGNLLDLGCLWGSFLDSARHSGFQVTGIEPYAPAATYAREVLKLNVLRGSLRSATLPEASFDAITILDVIEHLRDPVDDLRAALRLLRPNGVLAVITPNVNGLPVRAIGLKRRIFGQSWCPIDDLPWHLWGFTPGTITSALVRAGYRLEMVENFPPSAFTTNAIAGGHGWKRLCIAGLGGLSRLVRQSDRIAAYARREVSGP